MISVLMVAALLHPDPPPLTRSEFARLHRELIPAETEPWERVPWSTDLMNAARRAERKKKPLFIWAMNGHPLGCV